MKNISTPIFDAMTSNLKKIKKNSSNLFLKAFCGLLLVLGVSSTSLGQIAMPYSEAFTGIAAANGFPAVTGGAWTRSGTTTQQPTYIANQLTYNRTGNADTKFISFYYSVGAAGQYYFVGPFALTGGVTYQSSVLYKADGIAGFGPLSLTY